MVGVAEDAELFELNESVDGTEDMVFLRPQRFTRRLSERGVAFERFMKSFHAPPSLIERGDSSIIQRQVVGQ